LHEGSVVEDNWKLAAGLHGSLEPPSTPVGNVLYAGHLTSRFVVAPRFVVTVCFVVVTGFFVVLTGFFVVVTGFFVVLTGCAVVLTGCAVVLTGCAVVVAGCVVVAGFVVVTIFM
jgi:hypothetical protein